MNLYSDLGKEYAKAYRRNALVEMMNWAVKAEVALRTKAEAKRKENNTTGNYVEDDDANFYSDFASHLLAIVDELP